MGLFDMPEPKRYEVVGIQLLGAFLMATLAGCGAEELAEGAPPPTAPDGLSTVIVEGVGFETPESVLHDVLADVYLVSNIVGEPLDRDGRGFISRINPNGTMEELRWIDGGRGGVELNAPKGMAIRGDTLYVADLDCLHLFHRVTGEPAGSVCPPGATVLHDVSVDQDGTLFVTDTGIGESGPSSDDGAIFAIGLDGTPEVRFRGEELGSPNGIATTRRGIFVASSGSGEVYQLTPDGPRRVVRGSGWRLDGLVFTSGGSFAFSNWSDSTVLFVRAKDGGARGEVFTLVRDVPSPGDIGYDSRRERIMIPQLDLNRLLFIDLLS